MDNPAIEGEGLTLAYGSRVIVKDISLAIPAGSFCTIIGPNGCGKSTLLKALSRNLPLKEGRVAVEGTDLSWFETKTLARRMAFLAQSPHVPDQFTVKELVSYGRFPHTKWTGVLSAEDHRIVKEAMEETEITPFADRELIHLSGGERQRVWLAMALAQEAEILLLDEPTTYLDINHQFQTLELIRRLNREKGRTVLMVLHDLNQAARYSDSLFVMKEGNLVARGNPDEILNADLLKQVFSIESRIIRDEDHNCPYFIPVGGLQEK